MKPPNETKDKIRKSVLTIQWHMPWGKSQTRFCRYRVGCHRWPLTGDFPFRFGGTFELSMPYKAISEISVSTIQWVCRCNLFLEIARGQWMHARSAATSGIFRTGSVGRECDRPPSGIRIKPQQLLRLLRLLYVNHADTVASAVDFEVMPKNGS
jgi:hypothetical protein